MAAAPQFPHALVSGLLVDDRTLTVSTRLLTGLAADGVARCRTVFLYPSYHSAVAQELRPGRTASFANPLSRGFCCIALTWA